MFETKRTLKGLSRVVIAFTSMACAQFALGAPEQDYKKQVEPLLKSYCFDCHGDGANKGEVAFDEHTNLTAHVSNQKLWLSVWQNLQTQMMPPAKKPQPSDAERRQIAKWIERDVFKL